MARPAPDPVFVLRGSIDAVNSVRFYSPSNGSQEYLLSGCVSGEVRIWNLSSRRSEVTLNGHHGKGILELQLLKKDKILSHGRDNQILVWDVTEGRKDIVSSIDTASFSLCKCAVLSHDDRKCLIAVAGLEKSEVRVHDLESKKVIHRLIPPTEHKSFGMPMCLKFIDSKQLVSGYEDGSIVVWNLETNKIGTEKKLHSEPVMCLDYSITSKKGVSGSAEDKLVSWVIKKDDLETCCEVRLTNPGLSDVCIRQDDKIVTTAGWDNRIRLFGFKKMKPLAILSYHTDSVHCLDSSQPVQHMQYQHLLAAGSKDKHISLWSVYETNR
ncbi:guanine nucleotide-binding protein subunit beta-like protein 1 [Amphiura filiformis]|uniref:guanine nucleotide-binding protein subunit beta-like protein 1 n=1 Tax=Amphiura filiformis TaxID=82378 RepID=UPI003B2185D0